MTREGRCPYTQTHVRDLGSISPNPLLVFWFQSSGLAALVHSKSALDGKKERKNKTDREAHGVTVTKQLSFLSLFTAFCFCLCIWFLYIYIKKIKLGERMSALLSFCLFKSCQFDCLGKKKKIIIRTIVWQEMPGSFWAEAVFCGKALKVWDLDVSSKRHIWQGARQEISESRSSLHLPMLLSQRPSSFQWKCSGFKRSWR